MTAVSNTLLTASQFNVHVRDNLLETEAARATLTTGGIWFADGPNRSSEHQVKEHSILATQTTSSTEYVDLATVGPHVNLVMNAGLMIMSQCQLGNSASNDSMASYHIFEASSSHVVVDGGYDNPPNSTRAIIRDGAAGASTHNRVGCVQLIAGDDIVKTRVTIRMKYRVTADTSTGTFQKRRIQVMAL